eukprot:CAMPEP_0117445326 /NCGR_PEP_ID=MMETSP0759-20121206/5732_1 /TAXON_ID=63605 /ORGANISM="Percolomonas cosmopolitus, Strain WS" /LENGTH=196 /DNA_ID=CAMNT_0005237487 /DNA_START=259 /DNA_END=849 /DNA_ORIENTATION=+
MKPASTVPSSVDTDGKSAAKDFPSVTKQHMSHQVSPESTPTQKSSTKPLRPPASPVTSSSRSEPTSKNPKSKVFRNPFIVKVEPSPRVFRGSLVKIVGQHFRPYQSIRIGNFLLPRKHVYAVRNDCIILEIPLFLDSGLVALTIGGSARTYIHVEDQLDRASSHTQHPDNDDSMDTSEETAQDGLEMYLVPQEMTA